MGASNRLVLLVAPAAALAAVDLIVKATIPTDWWAFHHRSGGWVALSVVLLVGAFTLVIVPSRAVALAAGIMSAGVLGNLLSARWDDNWVPNPLTVGAHGYTLAFNLADVYFLVGNLLLMAALLVAAIRHRDRLQPPRAWERALLERLR